MTISHPNQVVSVDILSDSKSVLNACLSHPKTTQSIGEIQKHLQSLPTTINLFWIASHRSHEGNILADLLAKDSARNYHSVSFPLPLSISTFKESLRHQINEVWNKEWLECKKSKTTHAFLPTASHHTLYHKISLTSRSIAQIISGHCFLNEHLHKINLSASPLCRFGRENETITHFLFSCSIYDQHRTQLKEISSRLFKSWPPPLYLLCTNEHLLIALSDFINSSKRFSFPPTQF